MKMQQPKKQYSVQEYLELEEKAEYKNEYYQGEIFAMTGASINHNQIVINLLGAFQKSLQKDCRPFVSDLRLWIKQHNLFTYPDIMVVCGDPVFYENRDDTITNPLVIAEVLSKSTEGYDRGMKFEFYRSIKSLREYIIVDQYRVHIEHFLIEKSSNVWQLKEHNNIEDELHLHHVGFTCSVKDVYTNIDLTA